MVSLSLSSSPYSSSSSIPLKSIDRGEELLYSRFSRAIRSATQGCRRYSTTRGRNTVSLHPEQNSAEFVTDNSFRFVDTQEGELESGQGSLGVWEGGCDRNALLSVSASVAERGDSLSDNRFPDSSPSSTTRPTFRQLETDPLVLSRSGTDTNRNE